MNEFEKFYNKALKFLSYRPRSEKEVVDRLKSKKAPEEIIKKIVVKLKDYKFINDLEFANWWVEQRTKTKPRALRVIQFELKQKGISDEIIKSQFIIDNSQATNKQMAQVLAQKKISKYKNLPKREIYEKLGRYLASKGFNWDTIKQSIDEALK
jgi:regulatory protein